jgi:hypothetical protein
MSKLRKVFDTIANGWRLTPDIDPDKKYLEADFFDSSGTLADVPGMTFTVAPYEVVSVSYPGWHYGNATGSGLKVAFTGPDSPTFVRYSVGHWTAPSGQRSVTPATGFGTTLTEASGSAEELEVTITIFLINGPNAGTVQLQAASENSGTAITLVRGMRQLIDRYGFELP